MSKSAEALGKIVRETRKSRYLSQEALAEKVGVCKRTIIDIENNVGNPKFEILWALARELDLPLYQVFYPEAAEHSELKNVIMQELCGCTEYEMKVILSVIKCLRHSLKTEENDEYGKMGKGI